MRIAKGRAALKTDRSGHNFLKEKLNLLTTNIESVAIRKDEIEASIKMVNTIGEMLKAKGIR